MRDFVRNYIIECSGKSISTFDMQRVYAQWVEDNINDKVQVNSLLGAIDWVNWKYVVGFNPQGDLNFETPNTLRAK
jgi:hypothetical protein